MWCSVLHVPPSGRKRFLVSISSSAQQASKIYNISISLYAYSMQRRLQPSVVRCYRIDNPDLCALLFVFKGDLCSNMISMFVRTNLCIQAELWSNMPFMSLRTHVGLKWDLCCQRRWDPCWWEMTWDCNGTYEEIWDAGFCELI